MLAAMVVLLATGMLPAVVVGLLAAIAMVVFGAGGGGARLSLDQLDNGDPDRRDDAAFDRDGREPGRRRMLADGLVRMVGDAGPYALLAGLFLLTAILGQLISNTATALIIIPIGLAAAKPICTSPRGRC